MISYLIVSISCQKGVLIIEKTGILGRKYVSVAQRSPLLEIQL